MFTNATKNIYFSFEMHNPINIVDFLVFYLSILDKSKKWLSHCDCSNISIEIESEWDKVQTKGFCSHTLSKKLKLRSFAISRHYAHIHFINILFIPSYLFFQNCILLFLFHISFFFLKVEKYDIYEKCILKLLRAFAMEDLIFYVKYFFKTQFI